jgi:signal recognition particle subunit SRP54
VVLDSLSSSLKEVLRKVAGAESVTKELVKEVGKDLQRALLQADVNVEMVLKLTKRVEKRALAEDRPKGASPREHLIKIIYEELVDILGKGRDLKLGKMRILMVGLYGQGKTTTSGKLAKYLHKRGLKTALIAADVHRPAAFDQLKQLGEKINVPVYGDPQEKKAPKIARQGVDHFKDYDVLIVDTSGRDRLQEDLIEEIKQVSKVVEPTDTFLIVDATMGQQAGVHAKAFHEAVGVNGIVITKLDGTAKGGGALSAASATGADVVFIGVGEHVDDLERFDSKRFISRLLGWGDIKALLERAEGAISEAEAEEVARKIMSGKFTLVDMEKQLEMLGGMGSLDKLVSMLPGFLGGGATKEQLELQQKRLKLWKTSLKSMTKHEKQNPREIKGSRVNRIARGAGQSDVAVRDLLKQYAQMQSMVKNFKSNRQMRKQMEKMMREGGGDLGLGG